MAAAIPLQLLPSPPLDRRARPLRDLRISVIDACNFRCPYCMPEDAATTSLPRLGFDEIERLARAFVALGVGKLRLTGGEPLLRRDLPKLVRRLAAIDGVHDLALTTNGSLLARHAAALRDAGLHRLTVSLDTLDPQRFSVLSGRRGKVEDVLAGIAAAERAGFGPLKINCVVQRGINDADVPTLVEHFRGSGHVLRLIEYMDVGTCNGWQAERVVPSRELRDRIDARWPLLALTPNYRGEVAQRYAFADGAGELGFISSVSQPFCGDCNRARLSADGLLYTCLFAGRGHDLKPLLADGDVPLQEALGALWRQRGDRYSELRADAGATERVEMFRIGG